MAVYHDKAVERIKGALRPMVAIINHAKKSNMKEADTRTITVDVLTEMLGWGKYEDGSKPYITAEYAIKGGYADYAIVKKDAKGNKRIYAVIEIKQAGMKLNDNHFRQARDYAVNEGVKWIVLTNADDWEVYRVAINKRKSQPIPEVLPVFSVTLSNTDMRPGERAEWLYLLTEEASRKDELEEWYIKIQAVSPENLAKKILSKDVMDRIRLGIKKEIGINFPNEELAERIAKHVLTDNVVLENMSYYIKRCT